MDRIPLIKYLFRTTSIVPLIYFMITTFLYQHYTTERYNFINLTKIKQGNSDMNVVYGYKILFTLKHFGYLNLIEAYSNRVLYLL